MTTTTPEKKQKARRARGEGGLTQDARGLWIGRVELPRDPITGKRKFAKVSSMVYSDSVKKLNKLKRKLEDGGPGTLPTKHVTVSQWMSYFMEEIDRSRPSTRDSYRSKIKYIDQAIGRVRLEALEPADVRKLERYITGTLGLSSTSALQAYRILSRALKYAAREGYMLRNVATLVDPPKVAAANLAELSADEGIKVIDTVQFDRLGSRWAFALLTGARQGEILGLEIDRVDFETNTIDFSWQLQRVKWRHGCAPTGKVDDKGRQLWSCGRARGTDCASRHIDAPADWEHRHITGGLYWSRPKSDAGWRQIPLVEPLREILWQRIQVAKTEPNPYGLVWTADPKRSKGGAHTDRATLPLDGSPVDPSRDNEAWHAVLVRAGVTDVRVHDARHAAVTILYDLGVPESTIQDIVGQSIIMVTRKYRNRHKRSRLQAEQALTALGNALQARLELPAAAAGDDIQDAEILEGDAA